MRFLFAAALFGSAFALPASAQMSAASEAAPDPARIAAARPVIDKLWPLGTYRKMMDGTMSQMMDRMMQSMFDMRAEDFAGMAGADADKAKAAGESTLGELAMKQDPNFRERMRIMWDVMGREMIPLMEKVEPQVRQSLTSIYARRFTPEQLGEMDRFFSTPTGKIYAEQSMLVYMDPEMLSAMQAFAPEMLRAMPGIMKKIEAATAHLPMPKKPER